MTNQQPTAFYQGEEYFQDDNCQLSYPVGFAINWIRGQFGLLIVYYFDL